jgi:hypothetical protein
VMAFLILHVLRPTILPRLLASISRGTALGVGLFPISSNRLNQAIG